MNRLFAYAFAFFFTAALLLPAMPALAQERILSYDSQLQVNSDGSLSVHEQIKVHAEGTNIRRGIYRDFPTRYKDRYGNNVVVDLQVLDVLRDGKTEPWFTEQQSNGVRINTGNDDLLPVPAEYIYTLHYRTTRQLGFFADHDELYWNAIGLGWDFAIEAGSVDLRLPQPVQVDQLKAEGYTGPEGNKGQDYTASVPAPGQAHWQLTRPLAPHEGLTIVLSFPKGLVPEPSRTQRGMWLLKDNRGLLVALAGLLLMLAFCLRRWNAIGRDPNPGIVIARYDPPQGYSPAALRFIKRMGHDNRCFSADVLALAVAGFLRIEREKAFLKDEWTLVREPGPDVESLLQPERVLLEKIFAKGSPLVLTNTNASTMQAAQSGHSKALAALYDGKMFKLNGGSVGLASLIFVLTAIASFVVAAGSGLPAIIAVLVVMVLGLIMFGKLVRAPTPEGRKMLDEIEGLKRYLVVAERDELASMPGPEDAGADVAGASARPPMLDAKRYELLLPYAVALEVEDAWTAKFTLAVGAAAAAAATAGIAWYRGGGIDSLGSLSKAVGNSLSSQIASSSSPPGSSSGSGGGGSSGGGGGGGGGGGR
ncbi:DUF2207 domain-containing protein [Thermomonas sp.]|uniref:DUF2207 domain-containing protein n=1 Tax=Thermomonas sp. TaxID=1971895 RepID=UPI00248756E0|nr:DUF2207 domain-containing protein [Thermomonas sp.]MDI1253941.1 DUF2207 domain-containing protein [Thermomonas sp.]